MIPFIKKEDSIAATEAKAQQEPQLPWFLTPVTFPSDTQSTTYPVVPLPPFPPFPPPLPETLGAPSLGGSTAKFGG